MKKFFMVTFFLSMIIPNPAIIEAASDVDKKVSELETRIRSLEDYVKKLPPNLGDFSNTMFATVDARVKTAKNEVVVLNQDPNKFSKIETNVGTFLISINRKEKVEHGYLLYLYIGNPYVITFTGAKVHMRWGKIRDSKKISYEGWRQSLSGAEYAFPEKVEPGKWTELVVDLSPAEQLEYIECEMSIGTVELQ